MTAILSANNSFSDVPRTRTTQSRYKSFFDMIAGRLTLDYFFQNVKMGFLLHARLLFRQIFNNLHIPLFHTHTHHPRQVFFDFTHSNTATSKAVTQTGYFHIAIFYSTFYILQSTTFFIFMEVFFLLYNSRDPKNQRHFFDGYWKLSLVLLFFSSCINLPTYHDCKINSDPWSSY